MNKFKLTKKDALGFISAKEIEFPKYCSQIINLANQNAQGTRPKVVGKMSDLIQEFGDGSLAEWEEWYRDSHPEAIDHATTKVCKMIENLKVAISKIDEDMIKCWVEDLVIGKTYIGLRCQEAIIKKIAQDKELEYRLANSEEESKGIDGYIGDIAVSVKSKTYDTKNALPEVIDAKMIYYTEQKQGFKVEYDF
ncbi:MAG: MjaI family restriction endonuclease [Rikenellaceae bacterium]